MVRVRSTVVSAFGLTPPAYVEVGGETGEDVAWCYEDPNGESAKIAGRICFPQGKVMMYVDGVLEQKPKSRWD